MNLRRVLAATLLAWPMLSVVGMLPALAGACGSVSGACVQIQSSAFEPSQLSVIDGTSVYFVNESGGPATVTVQDGSYPSGSYASGALAPGDVSPAYQPSQGTHPATGYLVGGTIQMSISANPPPQPAPSSSSGLNPSPTPTTSPSATDSGSPTASPTQTATASPTVSPGTSKSPSPPRHARTSSPGPGARGHPGVGSGASRSTALASIPSLPALAAAGALPFSNTTLPGPQPERTGSARFSALRTTTRDVGLPAALAAVLLAGVLAALVRVALAEGAAGGAEDAARG